MGTEEGRRGGVNEVLKEVSGSLQEWGVNVLGVMGTH